MRTLYRQFIVTILIILACSVIIALFIANLFYLNITKKELELQHIEMAEEIIYVLENGHSATDFDAYLHSIAKLGYQIAVLQQGAEPRFYGEPFEKDVFPEEAWQVVTKGDIYHGMNSFSRNFSMMGHFANNVENTVGVPFTINDTNYGLFLRSNTKQLFSGIHMVLAIFILTIAIISILGVLFLTRQLTRPLAQLTEATKQLAKEDYSYPLDIERKDEIGQLAKSFNAMQLQLQHNDLARKAFISNVSHDFQSPLMNIQGYADLLKTEDLKREHREYVSIIDQEAKRLSSLTKQLLLLTSLDQPSYPLKKTDYRLDEQLKEVILKFYWKLEDRNLDVSYQLEPTTIYADKELLTNVWENLLSNAIKYNRPNGNIDVLLTVENSSITVQIRDTGIGIDEEHIQHLFERFYRVDKARKRDGTGLGLSIVQQIINLHGGHISVSSQVNVGTTFTIKLYNHTHSNKN